MAAQVIAKASSYIGIRTGDARHQRLVAAYNRILPRPVGYQLQLADSWCDAFITHVFDVCGLSALIGRECGVQRHVAIFKQKGIWLGKVKPKMGDIIVFDWNGDKFCDHIGLVRGCVDGYVQTIEGNAAGAVRERRYLLGYHYIVGYARPKYQLDNDSLAQEVIAGQWGVGPCRMQRLQAAGYDAKAIQARVNELLGASKKVKAARIRVRQAASHWLTGESIAPWVKGQVYEVHEMTEEGYLLKSDGVLVGWLKQADGEVVA